MLYVFHSTMLPVLLALLSLQSQEVLTDPLPELARLEEALKARPTDRQIAFQLGSLYSACALGITSITKNGLVLSASTEKANAGTAITCRENLAGHDNVLVLSQGAYRLAFQGSISRVYAKSPFDPLALAQQMADRAAAASDDDAIQVDRISVYRFVLNTTQGIEEKAALAKRIVLVEEAAFEKLKAPALRFYSATELAKDSLVAQDWERAAKYGSWCLTAAETNRSDWNYGNAIHTANIVLGEVALHNGDRKAAAQHLIAAGKTTGSPQLNSFGPNMTLARDLILAGDRNAVMEYLQLCETFWKLDRGRLEQWSKAIAQGGMPEFGANLSY